MYIFFSIIIYLIYSIFKIVIISTFIPASEMLHNAAHAQFTAWPGEKQRRHFGSEGGPAVTTWKREAPDSEVRGAFTIRQTIRPEDRGFRFMIRAKSRWSVLKKKKKHALGNSAAEGERSL